MKNIKLFFVVLFITIFPLYVFAATEYTEPKYGGTVTQCTGEYQDRNISTNGIAYFSYCMKATCTNGTYNVNYFYTTSELKNKNMIVSCTNGNSNPYVKLHKNGCSNYNSCNTSGDVKYCSNIWMYDCSKNSDGTAFVKPTQTKKPTQKPTQKPTEKTTESTTEATKISTRLQSLTLSKGSIPFNIDTYEYNLTLTEDVDSIEVTAKPENSSASIEVKNNTNLVDGSIIEIVVSAPNSDNSIYRIHIKKEVILSSNANLSDLTVSGYDLDFTKKITDYSLFINEEDKSLDIGYETEDENATVTIDNNNNLKNNSKITIMVEAEDGTIKYYYINISVKTKSSSLGTIFIIILILAIVAGAYYIYKKFFAGKSEDKYEYE